MTTTADRRSRIEGGILGLLIGDALGVPYEFQSSDELPSLERIEMTPPEGFARSWPGVAVGTWSDDGAQALALLASLLERDGLDLDDVGRRLLAWDEEGYMTPDGRRFDIGNQTRVALEALRKGASAHTSGPRDERANGNGSLMRVLPLALWHTGSDAELADDAMRQLLVTHGHARSRVCCALYCLWARRTMHGDDEPWTGAVAALRQHLGDAPERRELDGVVEWGAAPGGSGYVLDALHSARWAVAQGSYELAVKHAISLGQDTDTTACIAGGIAGVRDGVEAIPERWRETLRGKEIVAPLIEALVARQS